MKLAMVLYKYFPYGGLQRDFLRIAKACVDRGHEVTAYALSWQGEKPDWLTVRLADVRAFSNPAKYRRFDRWLRKQLAQNPADKVVGFNKMPGLDVYYCADPCYEYKSRNLRKWWYRFTRRYRHFSRYEKAVFAPGSKTKILMISDVQMSIFRDLYQTEMARMVMLPPGISREHCATEESPRVRLAFRDEFNLGPDDLLLLQVGSGFRTKGVDRSLRALAALPERIRTCCRLFVIGQDDPREFKLLASNLAIADRVTFFSGRDDVPRFMQGADVLMHPAYAENTGTVLLEALAAGLPVIVTDVCGYAKYIAEAGAGVVVPSPFDQLVLNSELVEMLGHPRSGFREAGIAYSKKADIFSMPAVAVDYIEQAGERL